MYERMGKEPKKKQMNGLVCLGFGCIFLNLFGYLLKGVSFKLQPKQFIQFITQ